MNREELRRALEREGIRETTYDLQPGRLSDERYCVEATDGGWSVWYAERGYRRDEEFFDTEDEACSELLLRLVEDQTTRKG